MPTPRLRLRSRRVLPALATSLVLAATGCGSDDGDDTASGAERLDAVTISGDVGSEPQVEWKSAMRASGVEVDTVVEGDGPEIEDGSQALVQLWIGNGFSEDQAFSTYDEGGAELVSAGEGSVPFVAEALDGARVGSRIAVTASAAEAFDSQTGNPEIGIGNEDPVLAIVDVVSTVLDGPEGTEEPAPDWAPTITETDGVPTALDFSQAPEPVGKFRKTVLVAGEGERVTKGQKVVVNYLGQVYGGDTPFDENFSKQPTTFEIGTGQVIEGWDKNVVGSDVGSRILIEVPPKLGYGEAGQPSAGITGTDTLFFVIDILAAA